MIASIYGQLILNALFHTGGAAGMDADKERLALISSGVDEEAFSDSGITAQMYFNAFKADNYQSDGTNVKEYDDMKLKFSESQWFSITDTALQNFTYNKNGSSVQSIHTCRGWKAVKNEEQLAYYPSAAYLALFTQMPDSSGDGYKEPLANTTYMRVNLHENIITCISSLNKADEGKEVKEAIITNKEIIAYPEVFGTDWGEIVGFGVFTSDTIGSGAPVFWGKLNEPKSATVNHVPLFDIDEFKVTLR